MTLELASGFTALMMNKAQKSRIRAEKERNLKLQTIKEYIEFAKSEIRLATENFNNVTEPHLIDFYIYKIQSEQNRYQQLLAEYKALELAPIPE